MRPISRILVPVRNFSVRSQPTSSKAAQLAKVFGARLELFHDIADPIIVDDALRRPGFTFRRLKADLRHMAIEGPGAFGGPLRAGGVDVSTAAAWDYPPYEAILRHASAMGADLIVAPRRARHRLPALLGYTDWELLRLSPVPVLLVKTIGTLPKAADARGDRSDACACEAERTRQADSRVCRRIERHAARHAQRRACLPAAPAASGIDVRHQATQAITCRIRSGSKSVFDKALAKANVPPLRRHLVAGDPAAPSPQSRAKRAAPSWSSVRCRAPL